MSATELRRAADMLHSLASGQPFKSETACAWETGHGLQREDGSWIVWTPKTYAADEQADYRSGAAYFNTVHPRVGLAVSDWLRAVAATEDDVNDAAPRRLSDETLSMNIAGWDEANAVARLILGGAS